MAKNEKREKLNSRLGFLLISAGCAIGCGNVWKFPYLCGQGGGAAFLIIYLIFLVIMGLPIMTMEFSLGRGSKKSPIMMYEGLGKPGWGWHGTFAMIGNIVLMMFYTVVSGWILKYFIGYISGDISALGTDSEAVAAQFGQTTSSTESMLLFTFIVIILGFIICSFKISKVLEKVEKYMMLILLLLMIVLAVRGITLEGGEEGLAFYLIPDFSKVTGEVVVSAMNQAFFTLSLGIGSMEIFGSYIDDSRSLMGESVRVIALDTFVAVVAGLIIFPACSAYGVDAGAGPSLIFITLPQVFNSMPGGQLWGILFFLFFTFAAFSTVLAVFENIVAMCMDAFHWERRKSSIICLIAMLALCLPCIFGFTIWSGAQPFGEGSGIMDLEDFFVSNLALPIGSLVMCIFCCHKFGWGWDNFTAEANKGEGMKVGNWMKNYCKWILPIIFLIVFFIGVKDMIPKLWFFN